MQSPYEHKLYSAQAELEHDMVDLTRSSHWKKIGLARASDTEGDLSYGVQLIKHNIDKIAARLKVAIDNPEHTRRAPIWYALLKDQDTEVVAYIALKAVINCISREVPTTASAISIGTRVEDQLRIDKFKKDRPDLFRLTERRLETTSQHNRNRRKAVMRLMSNRAGSAWKKWSTANLTHVGVRLLDIMIDCGIVQSSIRLTNNSYKKQGHIYATPEAADWVARAAAHSELHLPLYLPMLMPPKQWTAPANGGYWTGLVPQFSLVKGAKAGYLDEMAEQGPTEVYEAVNAVQNTPWCVNGRVLSVLEDFVKRGAEAPGLPSPNANDMPPKPHDIDANDAARKAWKKEATRVSDVNFSLVSKRFALSSCMQIARRFAGASAIYFPQQLDFRGRIYAVPSSLNPQGIDYAKALLTFAEGKPIDNGVAAGWLAIHGANVYGEDKVSLEDRISWVEDNSQAILAAANDPADNVDFWGDADKPWQFLAFCFEWAGFTEAGYGYVSSLPIAMDGSCNGLQHYSAALRDEVGGKATNLMPAKTPADIYAEVAEVARGLSQANLRDTSDPGTDAWYAAKWQEVGVDRKIVKRAVMTLPYGCSLYSCRDFIEEALREKLVGKPSPFAHVKDVSYQDTEDKTVTNMVETDGFWEASLYLQPYVWEAIGRVVTKAREAMGWLRSVASLASKEGLPITWATPDGFKVQQAYYKQAQRQILTHLDGKIYRPSLLHQTNTMDKRRMANGVAPNFVHSLDGCALRKYVLLAKDNGVKHFGLVHDSFATVAADVEMMTVCIRESFVELYEDNDVFTQFCYSVLPLLSEKAAAEMPPIPEHGSLDLSQVRGSDFFFA